MEYKVKEDKTYIRKVKHICSREKVRAHPQKIKMQFSIWNVKMSIQPAGKFQKPSFFSFISFLLAILYFS